MRRNYNMKKTISMKLFISELGGNFSDHMKDRLLELELRSVLTRKEDASILDIKHVEHTKYACTSGNNIDNSQKEYAYGQFIVKDGDLYFSEKCLENTHVMQAPAISKIYNSLNSENIVFDLENNAKKIDDNNIDFLVDNLLTICPDVSQRYLDIIKEMLSHERN